MEKFFCLYSDGSIHFLGHFENWVQAEEESEKSKLHNVWVFGEASAKSWIDTLEKHIGK